MATARTTEPLDPAYTTRIPGIPDPEPTITRIVIETQPVPYMTSCFNSRCAGKHGAEHRRRTDEQA